MLNNDLRRIDDVFLLASMSVQFPIFLGGTIYQIAVRFGFYPFLAVAGGIILGRYPWTRPIHPFGEFIGGFIGLWSIDSG